MNIIYIWLLILLGGILLSITIGILKIVIRVKRIRREKEQLKVSKQILKEQRRQTEITRQQYLQQMNQNNIEKR